MNLHRTLVALACFFIVLPLLSCGGKDSGEQYEYQRFEGFNDRDTLKRNFDDVVRGRLSADGVISSLNEPAAPPIDDCDSLDDHGEKIKCKNQKLLHEVCNNTINLVSQANLSISARARVEELNKECDFATAMVEATDPAEFFAVASETFFEKPKQLRAKHPQLYNELSNYYKIDPSEWF